MKAMLWKEWRENLKWAALALVVLGLAEFYALAGERHAISGENSITLGSSSYLLVTGVGCAAVGVLLGTLQILPELARDRWAALLHRPASRTAIFAGKVIAGLSLYLLATALPFLASIWYVATPGEFAAPFVPRMILPGLNDLAVGVACYLAALLLCLARGRWFGSRGALLLAAGAMFLLHLVIVGPPFLVPAVGATLFLLAAWGAVLEPGEMRTRPWVARAACVLVTCGGATVALLLVILGLKILSSNKPVPRGFYSGFEVTREEQVLRFTSKADGSGLALMDLSGHLVTDERYIGNGSYENFIDFSFLGFPLRTLPNAFSAIARSSIHEVQPLRRSGAAKENWYLLVRQKYLIGYDTLSRRCIGLCDRDGFKPPGALPVPFAGPLHFQNGSSADSILLWTQHTLYALAVGERRLTMVTQVPDDTIYWAVQTPRLFGSEEPKHTVMTLEQEIRFFDDHNRVILRLPYLHDPQVWNYVSMGADKTFDHLYFQSEHVDFNADRAPVPPRNFLDEVDLQGRLLHTYSSAGENADSNTRPGIEALPPYVLPTLPVALGYFCLPQARRSIDALIGETVLLDEPSPSVARFETALLVLGLILAICTLVWARRMGFGRGETWRWTIFVFAFGPAALLAFRLASDWPTRVRCPLCGRQRSVGQETCPSCGQPWPAPEPAGTEIFEVAAVS